MKSDWLLPDWLAGALAVLLSVVLAVWFLMLIAWLAGNAFQILKHWLK